MSMDDTAVQGKGGTVHSIDPSYRYWIEQYERGQDNFALRGLCQSASRKMQKAFPELRLVRGWVISALQWEYEDFDECLDPGNGHWWLETETGDIVDPTGSQFTGSDWLYRAFNEEGASTLPTGKCCNCGYYCYGGRTDLCSEECERSYASYLNLQIAR